MTSPQYLVDKKRVRFGAKTVRGADPTTFQTLLGPWACDGASVYFEGSRVGRARRDSFRALGDDVACDAKRIFYSRGRGDLLNVGYGKDDGFDPSRARAMTVDGRRYIVSDRVFVVATVLSGTKLDPATFRALGQGYARDASRLIWSGADQLVNVADPDLATFTVDAQGARDEHGRFVAGMRAPRLLPVETEGDHASAAQRLIDHLWRESLASWFADFDRSIPTDDGMSRVGVVGEVVTPIPEHRLIVSGARLTLEASGRRCEGTVSGLELLGGFLFGLARGKILDDAVSVRVALRTDGEIVSNAGTPPRWQACLDLAYLFEKLGHRQEAAFLLQRVARWKPSDARGSSPDDNALMRADLLLPEVMRVLPGEVVPQGSTTQAAAAWLVDNDFHRSTEALVRRDVASSVASLASATTVDCGRLASLVEPLLVLLDDPEPAVCAEAAASFDFVSSKALNRQAYAEALVHVDALAARHINWEVQCARSWACLAGLGRPREAEEAWAMCARLTAGDPPRTTTVWSSYPTFPAWRTAMELRLARSDS